MSHSVTKLTLHLPDHQNIVFTEDNVERVVQLAANRDTMLTAFFNLNRDDANARNLLYVEIPQSYVFKSKEREWRPRQRGAVFARIHYIFPKNRELFHLRILLMHVRGPQSFQDLRTVNGHVHQTFTAAAIALNLVENDDQWYVCIEEALQVELCRNVRFLFANICVHCHPVRPSALEIWERFKVQMSDDFIRIGNDTEVVAVQKSLQHIRNIMRKSGELLANFNLPEPDPTTPDYRIMNNVHTEPEITIEQHGNIADTMSSTFNAEQLVSIFIKLLNFRLINNI